MKSSCILAIGGALALLVSTGDTHAAQRRMSVITRADYAGVAKSGRGVGNAWRWSALTS